MTDLTRYARNSTAKLTTTGRKSGQARTVTIWFVVTAPDRIEVQHARSPVAQWYKNLLTHPEVTLDFGGGPLAARAQPIVGASAVAGVLARIRRKHWLLGPLIQRGADPARAVAAEIRLAAG